MIQIHCFLPHLKANNVMIFEGGPATLGKVVAAGAAQSLFSRAPGAKVTVVTNSLKLIDVRTCLC